MKLKKIYFDAFKSLLNKELEINFDCIGFVGINESGKSNILSAINSLGENRELNLSDTPKMSRDKSPSLRFQFTLDIKELEKFKIFINEWFEQYTLTKINNSNFFENLSIYYNIIFDKEKNQEIRTFSICGLEFEKNWRYLLINTLGDANKILSDDHYISLNKAIVICEKNIEEQFNVRKIHKEINDLDTKILELENKLEIENEKLTEFIKSNTVIKSDEEESTKKDELKEKENKEQSSINLEINNLEVKIETVNQKRETLVQSIDDFYIPDLINIERNKVSKFEKEIEELEDEIKKIQSSIQENKKIKERTEENESELEKLAQKQKLLISKNQSLVKKGEKSNKIIEDFEEPIENKYTNNASELYKHLNLATHDFFEELLPGVVFWEHSTNYILSSETLFSEILDKSDFENISRPLLNIFRIGLGIETIEDLKTKITEIQSDSNERSRMETKLNKEINDYVKSVWEDYDQMIKISLERDQIRVEIYDPLKNEASFYNMEERSQGCQTFLSFLLTIGAEAKFGVIKDTILLLDEPESHLHPSGVRYMLKQLIKISQNNLVIYATHSIFLIDRENFDRHIILKKEKENTNIIPSKLGRIGYLLQEELLYNALDTNPSADFNSFSKFNFIFEGDGDAVLFDCFYDKILSNDGKRPFKLKETSFFQGGKCSDIKKYFAHKPLIMGVKWIFILDKDSPANDLKTFIEGKFKDQLNNEIFVFQYDSKDKNCKVTDLEDLLPIDFILDLYFDQLPPTVSKEEIQDLTKNLSFQEFNNLIIDKYFSENKDLFKGELKVALNKKIKQVCEKISKNDFESTFPIYFNWVSDMVNIFKSK